MATMIPLVRLTIIKHERNFKSCAVKIFFGKPTLLLDIEPARQRPCSNSHDIQSLFTPDSSPEPTQHHPNSGSNAAVAIREPLFLFICEWRKCGQHIYDLDIRGIATHFKENHGADLRVPSNVPLRHSKDVKCLWDGCPGVVQTSKLGEHVYNEHFY